MALVTSHAVAAAAPGTGPGHAHSEPSAGLGTRVALLSRPAERFRSSIRTWVREHPSPDRPASERFASPESFGVSSSALDAIAACESGGNPAAVSPDGTYRGKYQFDYGTWGSVGGTGDPAAAPEAEQDMRAAMLYAAAGSSPWPVCGS
jgi:hypothetical protein